VIWKRTRISHKAKQDPHQRQTQPADLEMLEVAAAGDITLKYLDESGFCLWSTVSYSYIRRGHSKRMEQSRRRGKRLSILGFWQPQVSFEYGLSLGSFHSDTYLQLMEWQAQPAAQRLAQAGIITVIVQIELEWQHLKREELAGQMFEDEYDLALAVIEAIEQRGQRAFYPTKRFKFNST
jgi:putative transposase